MAGIGRRFKRARGRIAAERLSKHTIHEPVREQPEELVKLGILPNEVSMTLKGRRTTRMGRLASMVFAKCCAHAASIVTLAQLSPMFDHHAMMALARMVVEGSTMIAYLLDPVAEEEEDFRHLLLELHDTVNRLHLVSALDGEADDLREGRKQLVAQLQAHSGFGKVPERRRERLMTGEEMFVVGMRAVAVKMMGWDERRFGGTYSYLSAHAHSSPVSFMRMEEHGIDYLKPSIKQIELPAFALLVAAECLRRSMLRMVDRHPEVIPRLPADELARARNEDAESPLFRKSGRA